MCRESPSCRCCIDNILLILLINIAMILYLYIDTKNKGLLFFIAILSALSLIFFLVRIAEYGRPEWMINCKKICDIEEDDENIE